MRAWSRGLVASLSLGFTACGSLGLPRDATTQGAETAGLWRIFFVAGAAVAILVYGLILWSILRYRKRGEGDAPQFRENKRLEAASVLIPIAVVSALFVITFRAETRIDRLAADPALRVRVTGFNWSWRFEYLGENVTVVGTPDRPPEMVVPILRTIRVVLRAEDNIHAFFVPSLLFKRDAIPGRESQFDLRFERAVVDTGRCAEFCGIDHARMLFTLRAVPEAEFRAWLARMRAGEAA